MILHKSQCSLHNYKYSTIFKTYETDLDGIKNKLGFSQRSFADWGKQVKKSFDEAGGGLKGFTNALSTAFVAKNDDKDFKRIKSSGEIVTKNNINDYISELNTDRANELAEEIVNIDKAKGSWQKYFKVLEKDKHGDVIDFIKNTDDLSKITGDDLVKANESARKSTIAYNAALQQQTLGSKAATAVTGTLKTAFNAMAFAFIAQGIAAVTDTIITKITNIVNSYQNGINSIKPRLNKLLHRNKGLSKTTVPYLCVKTHYILSEEVNYAYSFKDTLEITATMITMPLLSYLFRT